jgi:hypothetical protein
LVPTLGIKRYTGVPLTFTMPTWITVGPTSFWNRGLTGYCPLRAQQCPDRLSSSSTHSGYST